MKSNISIKKTIFLTITENILNIALACAVTLIVLNSLTRRKKNRDTIFVYSKSNLSNYIQTDGMSWSQFKISLCQNRLKCNRCATSENVKQSMNNFGTCLKKLRQKIEIVRFKFDRCYETLFSHCPYFHRSHGLKDVRHCT